MTVVYGDVIQEERVERVLHLLCAFPLGKTIHVIHVSYVIHVPFFLSFILICLSFFLFSLTLLICLFSFLFTFSF